MSLHPPTPTFSLAQARGLVHDLFVPREWSYWVDFLLSILAGHLCFALTRWLYDIHLQPLGLRLALQAATFAVQCACFFRAVMFVHEIVHLPERKFRAFRIAWNLLCGIPFLLPSFTYQLHLDHHRRAHFGTEHDGEYLPLACGSPLWIVVYLSQCLWVPLLAVIRFGLLTPLAWIVPPLARLIHQRASSLVMDPSYLRPQPAAAALRIIRLQELGCCLFVWGCALVPPFVFGRPLLVLVVHAYLTSVVLILMSCVRTLAGHRFASDGQELSFVDQLLDSVTLDSDSLAVILINPVGLRYHATHHLFPSLPYHNLRAAHQRLMAGLPADSPYRLTVERSLLAAVASLWRRAVAASRQPPSTGYAAPNWKSATTVG